MRPIKALYTLAGMLKFEPLMDKTMCTFIETLRNGFAGERCGAVACPIHKLTQYCKWV